MRVVVGTYEKELYGFEWSPGAEVPETLFAMGAHLGCVKTLAASSKYLVSGSTDENVRIFNFRKLTDDGTLYQHQGTVTSVVFHKNSHLLTGGEDGCINIWRTKDWEVLGLAVHSSGRLALAAYKDRHLRLWDLLKGRIAWKKTLKVAGELVLFEPSGSGEFLVGEGKTVNSYEDGEIKVSLEHDAPVLAMAFVRSELLICGTNDGQLHVWNTATGERNATFKAHEMRVRSIVVCEEGGSTYALSVSSSGNLKMWEVASDKLLRMVQECELEARVTCMCVASSPASGGSSEKDQTVQEDTAVPTHAEEPSSEQVQKRSKKKRKINKAA